MLTFKSIEYRNILSVGNSPIKIQLNTNQSNLIIGRNGFGKSVFFDALTYVLYGKPYRDINKPRLINSINKSGLLVELEFETNGKEYVIRRGMKPNLFEVYENEKLIDQNAGAYDYQENLEKNILKMDFKAYAQIVVIGKVTYVPFMSLKPGARREVIEDLLDLQIFTNMNVLNKENISTAKKDLADKDMRIEVTKEKISFIRNNLNKLISNTQEQLDTKKSLLEEQLSKRENILIEGRAHKTKLDQMIIDYEALALRTQKKHEKFTEIRNNLYSRRIKTIKELEFFNHTDECPTCSQNIDTEFKSGMVSSHNVSLADLEEKIVQLNKIAEQIQIEKNEVETKNTAVNNARQEFTKLVAASKHVIELINNIESDIKLLESQQVSNIDETKQVEELQNELKKLITNKHDLTKQYDLYKLTNILLKDTGIKAQLIKQYIPIINQYIEKYLGIMDFFVQFEIDENFEENIKSRYRDEFTYNSFSEGEKFRIDMALLMVWRTIAKLRNSCKTNLLMLDEVFDGSLDTEGIDAFMTIIDELISEGQTVFVISHKSALIDKFQNTITFEKKGNFTLLVDE